MRVCGSPIRLLSKMDEHRGLRTSLWLGRCGWHLGMGCHRFRNEVTVPLFGLCGPLQTAAEALAALS
jgi:hypothetical protein